MKINAVATYKILKMGELAGKTVVVVNGIRTNATITTALMNGCDRVIPVDSVEDAMAKRKLYPEDAIVGGAFENMRQHEFDLGNSPEMFTPQRMAGKTLIHYTPNGTKAISACFDGKTVLIGSCINATAVARAAVDCGEDIFIVCAGADGRLCVSDLFAAGAIIDKIDAMGSDLQMDDCVLMAMRIYRCFREQPEALLADTLSYEGLMHGGFAEDVEYCLTEDIADIAPIYDEGLIR